MKRIKTYSDILFSLIINPITDVLFPSLCYICNDLLDNDQKIICPECWNKIPPYKNISDKTLENRHFSKTFILFQFDETVRILIHLFKYKDHLSLTRYFARQSLCAHPALKNEVYDALVPVPLHKTRIRERGYNQSEVLAKALADLYGISLRCDYLQRIRPTKSQTKISHQEREKNVLNAFRCQVSLDNKRVLLIDDVITTGSTVDACAKILKEAGAAKIDVFAIAHPQ